MLGHPRVAGIGFLFLVYFGVFVAPGNPQTYDPSAYLISVCLVVAAVILFSAGSAVILPVSDRDRRRWIFMDLRDDVLKAAHGRTRRTPDQMVYLTVDRVVRLARLQAGPPVARRRLLVHAVTLSFLALAAGRARQALGGLGRDEPGTGPALDPTLLLALERALEALASLSPAEMGQAAQDLAALVPVVATPLRPPLVRAITDLVVLSRTVTRSGIPLRHLSRSCA
ncbi:FUSC family protein [Acetobacteraceae bacterium KSS12]|uniref:FUSC family protein n=1 Tax=Rhizosaccharibacter radicis TaxID=2782605 RepID=A0ABT1W0S2_9PROT|nr:FUSC family protein [Acetobacteraceae bacterium KSS12]